MYRPAAAALPRLAPPLLRPRLRAPAAMPRHYATKGATPPPPPKLSFTERLRTKLWRPGAAPPSHTELLPAAAATTPAAIKPSDTPGYAEALDARGLAIVGLDPSPEEWDVPVFTTNHPFTTPSAIVRAVHRAVIETHTPLLLTPAAPSFSSTYTGPEHLTPHVHIAVAPRGAEATFEFYGPAAPAAILAPAGKARAYSQAELYPDDAAEEHEAWVHDGLVRRGWATLRVRAGVRFALVKRVAQLTGLRVGDAAAGAAGSVAEILDALETRPRAKKLFEVVAGTALPALPNVVVYASRVRPWDRERALGRERPVGAVAEYRYPFEARGRK